MPCDQNFQFILRTMSVLISSGFDQFLCDTHKDNARVPTLLLLSFRTLFVLLSELHLSPDRLRPTIFNSDGGDDGVELGEWAMSLLKLATSSDKILLKMGHLRPLKGCSFTATPPYCRPLPCLAIEQQVERDIPSASSSQGWGHCTSDEAIE